MNRLHEIAKNIQELEVSVGRLGWTQYTTGYDFGVDEAELAVQKALESKESYEVIKELMTADLESTDKRRVAIMERDFRPYHLSDELNKLNVRINEKTNQLGDVLNKTRSEIDGRPVTSPEIFQILAVEEDREKRRAAYLAQRMVNRPLVDAGFIDLINMRKEYADKYGAADFVELSLKEQELDPAMFDGWTEQIREVQPIMKKVRAGFATEYLDQPDLQPWDERFLGGRISPEKNKSVDMSNFLEPIAELFNRFGYDVAKYNITYDVFPRANKSEWGYNFPIEYAVDSRILANVRNRFFEFDVLLHETGHGMHSFNVDPAEIILNRGISGIISEGIANLFGSLQTCPEFYAPFFPGEEEQAAANFARLKRWNDVNALRAGHRILFDQALYRTEIDNIDDIHELWWRIGRELFDEEPYAAEPVWGMVIHYTTHPIYLHNYLLGDLTYEMLKSVFTSGNKVDGIMADPAGFGKFLGEEVMRPAGRYPYPELYRRISGEDFSLKYLVDKVRALEA
ncbi:MAG: peptidase M3A and M3B thimet/oligopeptidase F [bacterium]|nr:peptidase M3A and M3B thimet/oligopeptidase F [bacterium]